MFFSTSSYNLSLTPLPAGVKPLQPSHPMPARQVWRSFDGTTLPFMKAVPSDGTVKAVVIIAPGIDGTTGDYASITEHLVRHGYAVYGCENRAFAYGPWRERGDALDWRSWLLDWKGFSKFVRSQHPGLPVIWHGHSFGGVQILQTAAESNGDELLHGLIVHSPGFGLMLNRATILRRLRYVVISWMWLPHIRMMEKSDMPMSDDPVWDARWKHSPDRLRKGLRVRYFIKAADMGVAARKSSPHLKMPVLAMWGGKDRLVIGGNEKLRAEYDHYMRHELAGGRATQSYHKDGMHLLTEGTTKEAALETISQWLATVVKSPGNCN